MQRPDNANLEAANQQYKEYQTITEDLFKDLLKLHRDELARIKPVPRGQGDPQLYSTEDIRTIFEEKRAKTYYDQLEKYIKSMYSAHLKQSNKKMIAKNAEIERERDRVTEEMNKSRRIATQLDELRLGQALNEDKQQPRNDNTIKKFKEFKEWELVRSLFEQADSTQRDWATSVERQFRTMSEQLAQIQRVKLGKCDNNPLVFLTELFKACHTSESDRKGVFGHIESIEKRAFETRQELEALREQTGRKMKELKDKEEDLNRRTSELAASERQVNAQSEELGKSISLAEEEKRTYTNKISQAEQNIRLLQQNERSLSLAKKESDVGANKFKEVEEAIASRRMSRSEQLQTILKHFAGVKADAEIDRLARDWQDSLKAHENSVTLQRLIYARLAQQKQQLINESGLLERYNSEKDKMDKIVTETIKISLAAFNEIEDLIANKLLGIRYDPIEVKLNMQVDKIIDTVAVEYHVRISRISQRISQLKRANHRRTVEYVMREAVNE